MKKTDIIEIVKIPEKVQIVIDGNIVKIKGPKGETQKTIGHPKVSMKKEGNDVKLEMKNPTSYERAIVYALKSHLNNLIHGSINGYVYTLKVCSGHFPMTAKVEGEKLVVSNFLGEKIPRRANVLKGVSVKVQGDQISVEGINLGDVSQTAANIEIATRILNRDRRRFQEGIFITSKAGAPI